MMALGEDYNREFKEERKKIGARKEKPTLFLHACCGPCLTYPLSLLVKSFDVTVGFFNPNISPESEYLKREKTREEFLFRFGKDNSLTVPFVLRKEDFALYDSLFALRKRNHEGGSFCLKCHAYRREIAYSYAFRHHFDYFTTVRTVSCKKPSKELNEIAQILEKKYPTTKYLYSDFKKEGGRQKGIEISKAYSLYRQGYCGCLPSLKERQAYIKRKREQGRELTQSEKELRTFK